MRFLKKNKTDKIILCVSDLHLGAGSFYEGRKNNLEDFNYDKEFVEFLEFYSSGGFQKVEVELIINGDFLDFLAVPFVEYFDDNSYIFSDNTESACSSSSYYIFYCIILFVTA